MRATIAAFLLGCAFAANALATEPERPAPAPLAAAKTAKERLGAKATDEQRLDDCKVAVGRRTRPRPTKCSSDLGS